MVREINLSQLYPIDAERTGEKIAICLHGIIEGELSSNELSNMLRTELPPGLPNVTVAARNGQLILELDTDLENKTVEKQLSDTAESVISRLLPRTLRNRITGNRLIYITRGSGIPLIGRIDFGIIDRGTNLIQVRPMTGCLLNCPFCSVDSGPSSRTRVNDFIIEPEYMIDELKNLCNFKGSRSIELHIDGQGEPTLYPYLPSLVKAASMIPGVKVISLQTNGVPLTNELVDKLAKAGLSRINLSLNALDSAKAVRLSGYRGYDLTAILGLIRHVKNSEVSLLVAPLWIPGLNDDDILKIVRLVKKLGVESKWPIIGIQNYLVHKLGRKMEGVKPYTMKQFRERLLGLERMLDLHPLILSPKDFCIEPAKSYPKPFRKGETAEVEIVEIGRMPGEMLGVGRQRSMHVITMRGDIDRTARVRILRTKHNIFVGKTISQGNS